MKMLYKAEDGTIFNTELECAVYEESLKQNHTFEKSRFFSAFGCEYKTYDCFIDKIYVHPAEYAKMAAFLTTKNRNIKGYSKSNIYSLNNMCFHPIEDEIEKEYNHMKRIEETILKLTKIKHDILTKTGETE